MRNPFEYGGVVRGETFRVLKEKELAKFGEYRTRRLVLKAWDAWGRGERGAERETTQPEYFTKFMGLTNR